VYLFTKLPDKAELRAQLPDLQDKNDKKVHVPFLPTFLANQEDDGIISIGEEMRRPRFNSNQTPR